MRSTAAIGLVAKREITTRIRSKALIWSTIIMLVGIVAGSFVVSLLGDRGPDPDAIGVTDAALTQSVETAAATTGGLITVEATTQADGEAALLDDALAVLLSVDDAGTVTATVHSELPESLEPTMTVLAQQVALDAAITELGGDPGTVNQQVLGAQPTLNVLEPPDEAEVSVTQSVIGMIAGVLIFIAIMTTGQMVAQGVVEEKSSRVVELLLSAIRPWQLIAGKVLGIGVIGLGQMLLVVGAGAGSAVGFGLLDSGEIEVGSTVVWVLVWFLLGYTIYATSLGALASLVSRQEDVGSVITPVMILMLIPYMVGVTIAPWEPQNTLVIALSLFPFFSPLLMPIRIALDSVAGWELALSVGLSVALIVVLVVLAGKIYSRAVMRTGAKVSLKEALRRN